VTDIKNLLDAKTDRNGPVPEYRPDLGPCWLWTGSKVEGYGKLKVEGAYKLAHRLVFECHGGPIAHGMQLDHLCRVRHCVNPSHLEQVTQTVNIMRGMSPIAINARKTHCSHGHLLEGGNVRIVRDGSRECVTCRKEIRKRWRSRRKAA
jgi:hypothetical protein